VGHLRVALVVVVEQSEDVKTRKVLLLGTGFQYPPPAVQEELAEVLSAAPTGRQCVLVARLLIPVEKP